MGLPYRKNGADRVTRRLMRLAGQARRIIRYNTHGTRIPVGFNGTRNNHFVHASFLILGMLWAAWPWTFLGNNARTGRYDEMMPVPLIKYKSLSINKSVVASPIVVNDTVYIGCRDSTLYALYNGGIVWRYKTGGWIDATVAYKDGKVYAGSRDGMLYILDGRTGDSVGVIENNNEQCSSPLLYDSIVVFGRGGWNTSINAYNSITGNHLWFVDNRQTVYSSAARADSMLCYGENGGSLVAVNAYSGEIAWRYQTNGGTYFSSPSIEDNTVWFSPGGYDYYLYAVALDQGSLLWKSKSGVLHRESVSEGMVRELLRFKMTTRVKVLDAYQKRGFIDQEHAALLRVLTKNGNSPHDFIPYGGIATSSVAVGPVQVYVVYKEYGYPKPRFTITAFQKNTGKEQWRFSELRSCEPLGFCSTPVVTDSLVFVGWGEGKMYAFGINSGKKVWEDSLDGDVVSTPAVGNGKLYVATAKGTIVTYLKSGYMDARFENSTYAYPNPARGGWSHIQVYAERPAQLKMTVYTFADRPVFSFTKNIDRGRFTYDWNTATVANGVYFAHVQLKYTDGEKSKKVVKVAVLR